MIQLKHETISGAFLQEILNDEYNRINLQLETILNTPKTKENRRELLVELRKYQDKKQIINTLVYRINNII